MICSPIDLRDREITGEVLEICRASGQEDDRLFRCTLRECELILTEPCGAYFLDSTFEACRIIAKKECRQKWDDCQWIGCSFIGDYVLVLGQRDEYCTRPAGWMIAACDFSQTNLHGTAFCNAELVSTKFPGWPNFTILEPLRHMADIRSLKFSPMVQIWWDGWMSNRLDKSITSITLNWAQTVKDKNESKLVKWEFDKYEDEVRSTLSRLPFVIM